jgi:hypothetical protein
MEPPPASWHQSSHRSDYIQNSMAVIDNYLRYNKENHGGFATDVACALKWCKFAVRLCSLILFNLSESDFLYSYLFKSVSRFCPGTQKFYLPSATSLFVATLFALGSNKTTVSTIKLLRLAISIFLSYRR